MKLEHFEELKPICPHCRLNLSLEAPLKIGSVIKKEIDVITQGILLCTTIIVALLADFLLLPALVLTLKPFGQEEEAEAASQTACP